MSHDATLRSAALLLRKGHPPDVLLGALDDETAVRLVTATLAARPAVGRMILEAEAASRLRCDVPRLVPGAEVRCRPPVALSVGGTAFCAAHWPADAVVAPRSGT